MMHTTATRTASGQSTQFNDDGEAKDDWHTTHAQCLTPYCSWAYYLTCSSSILAGTRSLPTCKDLVPSINEPTATLDNDEGNAEKGEPRSLLFDAVTHLGAEGPASHARARLALKMAVVRVASVRASFLPLNPQYASSESQFARATGSQLNFTLRMTYSTALHFRSD